MTFEAPPDSSVFRADQMDIWADIGLSRLLCRKEGRHPFLPDCLGVFSGTGMASAALEREKDVHLYTGACSACGEADADAIENNIFSANRILALIGAPWRIYAEGEFDPESTVAAIRRLEEREREKNALSRRGFFNILRSRAVETAATVVSEDKLAENRERDSIAPGWNRVKKIPEERSRLLRLIRDFDSGSPVVLEEKGLPFYSLAVSDKCTLCDACHDFCPTGAVQKYEEGLETGLKFDISRCIRCAECEKICPEGAITRGDYIDGRDVKNSSVVSLVSRELRECAGCEMKFLPDANESKCRRCLKLEKLESVRFAF